MERLEEVTWPKPLADLLEVTLAAYRQTHPWISPDALSPKSVVREMYERGMTFNEFISAYGLSRSEGLRAALPHRRLPHAAAHRARVAPHRGARGHHRVARRAGPPDRLEPARRVGGPRQPCGAVLQPGRPRSRRPPGRSRPTCAPSRCMVRNAMFHRVELASRDAWEPLGDLEARVAELTDPPQKVVMDAAGVERRARRLLRRARLHRDRPGGALAGAAAGREDCPRRGGCARSSSTRTATATGASPPSIDLAASDEVGAAVLTVTGFGRLGG